MKQVGGKNTALFCMDCHFSRKKLFHLIKHSVFESKTFCGNMRPLWIQRVEINFQRRWIIIPRDKGQVPMGNLNAAMLSATVVGGLVQSQVQNSFRSGICTPGSGTYAFLVLSLYFPWGCWGGGTKPLKLLGRCVSESFRTQVKFHTYFSLCFFFF